LRVFGSYGASGTVFGKFVSIYVLTLWAIIFWDFILKILFPYVQTTVFFKYINALDSTFYRMSNKKESSLNSRNWYKKGGKTLKNIIKGKEFSISPRLSFK